MDTVVRSAVMSDAQAISDIYAYYITDTTITFEEQPVSAAEMAGRLREIQSASLPWMVAEQSGRVVGYAYASQWKARSAYRYSVETSVYLQHGIAGQGLGRRLYQALFDALKERGFHVVIGGIALPNEASVALHEKFGMKKMAHFEQVGFKFGQWIDVAYWQRVL